MLEMLEPMALPTWESTLEEHIAFCIEAMKGIAGELGLARTAV